MEIWNSRYLDNNRRFAAALAAGFVSAVALGFAYGILHSVLRFEASVFYILIGWCIGWVIRKAGRGVHRRFAVAGAVFTFLAIFIGDICSMYTVSLGSAMLLSPGLWPTMILAWMRLYLSTGVSSLLSLLFRVAGIYFGYTQSVIL